MNIKNSLFTLIFALTAATASASDKDFKVLNVTPRGQLPSSVEYPAIQVQFSKPVVALQELGEVQKKSDIFSIEPPLEGVFRWKGSSILSFESSSKALPQKKYTIKVNPKLSALDGSQISGNLLFSFETEELKLTNIVPGWSKNGQSFAGTSSVPPKSAKSIGVYFNSPVKAGHVSKSISVSDSNAGSYSFKASQAEEKIVLLELDQLPPEDVDLVVTLKKGAESDTDCLATKSDQSRRFHTLVKFKVLSLEDNPRWLSRQYEKPVRITFSSDLKTGDENQIAAFISTEPPAPVTGENISVWGRTLVIHGLPFDYKSSYTLKINRGLTDVYNRPLSEDYTYTITVPDAASYVNFKNSGLIAMESSSSPKIEFYFQNIKAPSSYTIEPLTDADGSVSLKKSHTVKLDPEKIQTNKRITQIVDLSPYLDKVGQDYRGAVRFSANVSFQYTWRSWHNEETRINTIRNTQIIQLTDLGISVHYSNDKAIVHVTRLSTGEPVRDAEVNIKLIPNEDEHTGYGKNYDYDDKSLIIKKRYENFASGKTDSSGIAEIDFSQEYSYFCDHYSLYVEAKTKDDRAIFEASDSYYGSSGLSSINNQNMRAFIFTDSGLYKPGESVNLKVIDRNFYRGTYSIPQGKESSYTLQLSDNSGRKAKEIFKKSGQLSEQGTAWAQIKLPSDIKPGSYTITYTRSCNGEKQTASQALQVQFFEKVRFAVSSEIADTLYYSGDALSAKVSASYLGGGALDNGSCTWRWSRQPVSFRAKKEDFKDMTFGPIRSDGKDYISAREKGNLNSQGQVSPLTTTGGESLSGKPYSYNLECQVVDSGNQAISSSASATVHSSKFYIGLASAKKNYGFASAGKKIDFNYACITPDEILASPALLPKDKRFTLEVFRENYKSIQEINDSNGQLYYRYEREDILEEKRDLSLDEKNISGTFSYTPQKGGSYLIRLSSTDVDGRKVITEKSFYVTGKDWLWYNENDSQEIKLLPSKDEYEVGEKIEILAQTELPAGTYLLTLEREKILNSRLIKIDSPTFVIELDGLGQEAFPVVYARLTSFSDRKSSSDVPKAYYGVTAINVSRNSRTFKIEVTPNKTVYNPGDDVELKIKTLSSDGKPLPYAELALMAVDRGLLDLTDYHVKNPAEFFYNRAYYRNYCFSSDLRPLLVQAAEEEIEEELEEAFDEATVENSIMLADAAPTMSKKMASSAAKTKVRSADDTGSVPTMQTRKNFDSVAAFIPKVETDKDGNATLSFKLPDSLTSYRITAVGVKGCLFGSEEKEVQAANPLSARQVLPRKLRLGDKGEVGLTLTNLDSDSKKVAVSLEVLSKVEKEEKTGLEKLIGEMHVDGKSSKEINIAGQSTLPLYFTVDAVKSGWVTLRFTVQEREGDFAEEILLPLEIEKPYIYETVALTGQVEDASGEKGEAVEKIVLPLDAEDGRGSLLVQLDPTRLGALREAVGYVFHYPYGCMEQRSAAVLPLVAFGKYIDVFGLNSEVKDAAGVAAKEIASWKAVQNSDGGFPYWPDGYYKDSNFYVSMRIAEIYALAKERGIVKGSVLNQDKLLAYIEKESRKMAKEKADFAWTSYPLAYASYVLSLYGKELDGPDLKEISSRDDVGLESLTLCALSYLNLGKKTVAEKIAVKLRSYTRLTTRGIDIARRGKRYYWCFFNSDSEPYALFLQLFTRLNKDDSINAHLVYELLKMQSNKKGYWQSTAVTSRVLLALDSFIQTNSLEKLNFTAQALLEGESLAKGRFSGLAAESVQEEYDFSSDKLKNLSRGKNLDLKFQKEGEGKLYYAVSMKYAIPAQKQVARDEGLCLFTEIYDAETGERVTGSNLEYGKTYVQKATLSAVTDCEYVALRVPVPAGCEIVNAAFAVTGSMDTEAAAKQQTSWNYGLSYKGIYDTEVQYFWNRFYAGSQDVTFTFRAKTRGTYQTPCASAECMYEEEIFGRSDGKVWTVR